MLKFLQTFAVDFPYIYLQFFPRILVSRKKHFYRQVYKKWCKVVPAHAAAYKQGSFHFTIHILFRTVVLRKLFDITFWYKHCTVISHAVAVTGSILKIVSGAFSFLTIHMSSFTNALVDDKEKNWTLSIIKCEFKLTRVLFLSIPKIYNSDCYLWDIRFRICNRTQNAKMDFSTKRSARGFPFFRFFPFAFDCKINHRWFVQLCKRIPLKSSQVIWNMLRMWKTCPWGSRNVSNILIMTRLVQLKCH